MRERERERRASERERGGQVRERLGGEERKTSVSNYTEQAPKNNNHAADLLIPGISRLPGRGN